MTEPPSEPESSNSETPTNLSASSDSGLSDEHSAGSQAHLLVTTAEWRGPLPPPEHLAAFKEVSSDLPDRIVSMAEEQQSHRHGIENKQLSIQSAEMASERRERFFGQIFAFLIAVTALVTGGVLVVKGYEVVGTLFGGMPLVWVVSAFIQERRGSNDEGNTDRIDEA